MFLWTCLVITVLLIWNNNEKSETEKFVVSDSSVVTTTLNGYVLVLESLEKCERKVLPVLNHLLENYELLLEDGRWLISERRDNQLIESHHYSVDELKQMKIEMIHSSFRIITIRLPTRRRNYWRSWTTINSIWFSSTF